MDKDDTYDDSEASSTESSESEAHDADIVGKEIPMTNSVPASSSGKVTDPGSNEGTCQPTPGQPEVPLPKPCPGPASTASVAASDSEVLSGAPHRD